MNGSPAGCSKHTVAPAVALLIIGFTACTRAQSTAHAESVKASAAPSKSRQIRATGTIQAVRFHTVQVPQIAGQANQQGGQQGRVTLTRLIPNGSVVKPGELLAEFDHTQQIDNAREAEAKFDDLGHQVDQRNAQNRADAAKREAEMAKAQADLAKAEIELRKGPLLSDIDRQKNQIKLEDAQAHVASLKKSNTSHDTADAAALRILELQRERQKVSLERARLNVERLQIRATLAGMVALENIWRNGTFGHPQEGDQLWPGQALLRIFDPAEMEVSVRIGEPDGALLQRGWRAQVRLDAYPDLLFHARFQFISPVATSAVGSPVKSFNAMFRLENADPHLLPDLSAAVILDAGATGDLGEL